MNEAVSLSQSHIQSISANDIDHKARVRALNDELRTGSLETVARLGKRVFTQGVWALGPSACLDILLKLKTFSDFEDANDPWKEHDFGAFHHKGEKIFWKIDYYDKACEAGSPDPSDPDVTCRVLTVMLASEY